jgi:hypothetical protein
MDQDRSEALSSNNSDEEAENDTVVNNDRMFFSPFFYKGKVMKDVEYLPYKDSFRPSLKPSLNQRKSRMSKLDPKFESLLALDHKSALSHTIEVTKSVKEKNSKNKCSLPRIGKGK